MPEDKIKTLSGLILHENGDIFNNSNKRIARLVGGVEFDSGEVGINVAQFYPIIDTCEQGHNFAKLSDHPKKDGRPRCPTCMSIGLNLARAELDNIEQFRRQAIQ